MYALIPGRLFLFQFVQFYVFIKESLLTKHFIVSRREKETITENKKKKRTSLQLKELEESWRNRNVKQKNKTLKLLHNRSC